MRIWHWQALKECKIKQKPNPPNCCDNCYLPHFLASFWRQTRFSTLPRQVLTWLWKLRMNQKYLRVFHWCLKLPIDQNICGPWKSSIEIFDLSLIWYPTRLAWPSPSGGDQDTSAWKSCKNCESCHMLLSLDLARMTLLTFYMLCF